MKPSTRNQFTGTVRSSSRGEAMAVVKTNLDGGQEITSSVASEAADGLGLAEGRKVTVLVKSTDVAPAID